MQKTRKRVFLTAILSLALMLTVFLGVGTLEASAATYTTAKYTTYGTYTYDGSTYSGYPSSYFKIMMHGSSTSGTGTIYNDRLTGNLFFQLRYLCRVSAVHHILQRKPLIQVVDFQHIQLADFHIQIALLNDQRIAGGKSFDL